MQRKEWEYGTEKTVRRHRIQETERPDPEKTKTVPRPKPTKSLRKKKKQAHPNRERALAVLAAYPYRKAAAEITDGRITSDIERARTFVARVDLALSVLAAEERSVLLNKSCPLPDGSLPTGFDRYERAACEKSAYYRLRARALEKFALALFGRY